MVPQDDLEAALSKASMPNKTVIITIVNKAYVEGDDTSMLDLFLESFWIGEGTREMADHLLVVALDQTAFDRCIFRRLHCYKMVSEDGDIALPSRSPRGASVRRMRCRRRTGMLPG